MMLLTDKSASTVAKPGSVSTVNNKRGLNDYSNQFWELSVMFMQGFLVQMLPSCAGLDNNVIPWKEGRKTNKQINRFYR